MKLKLIGDDPLNGKHWKKHTSGPVFSSGHGSYGTGHNGYALSHRPSHTSSELFESKLSRSNRIFYSPDGTEVWNVYHAVANPKGGCNPTRSTFVTKVNIKDGKLDFGKPA